MTLRQAVTEATAQLNSDPLLRPTARLDAELLLLHSLQITRAQFHANSDRALTPQQASIYRKSVTRRLALEPIQYITGHQEFYGLTLSVTPAVLIPRPETEHLVESVLAEFAQADPKQPLCIADVGTGSGAIAIALAAHLPQAEITALEISSEAIKVAQLNARAHNLTHRIKFIESDLLAAPLRADPVALFDAIVSNPPYVSLAEAPELHPQVRFYEPEAALFAGSSGLDIYRRLIPEAHAALKPGGLLALEIGHNQSSAVACLLTGWGSVSFIPDLQGISRVVLARKAPQTPAV